MPSTSSKQRMLMGLAEHHPEQVSKKNRGVLKMSHQQLHDFASTKGLKHDTAPPGGFAHMGTTVEGPHFRSHESEAKTTSVGASIGGQVPSERDKAFKNAGSSREGPHFGGATRSGKTFDMSAPIGAQEHMFANAGSSKEGYYTKNCSVDKKGEGWGTDGESKIRLHRGPHEVVGRDRLSGDHQDGFHTNLTHTRGDTDGRHGNDDHGYAGPQLGHSRPDATPVHSGLHAKEPDIVHNSPPKYRSSRERASLGHAVHEGEGARGFQTREHTAPRERANAESHYGLKLTTRQPQTKSTGGYEGAREANWTPSGKIAGQKHQAGPRHGPGRAERHAFQMATPQRHVVGERTRRTA